MLKLVKTLYQMKKIIVLLAILLPVFGMAQSSVKVDVYYFHITNRCSTCIAIEAQIRKTIDTHFSAQIKDGSLVLHVLNCELPENKTIAEKYLAYGSTLAITRTANGKESTEDITGWAFQKIHSTDTFDSELKAKIEAALRP